MTEPADAPGARTPLGAQATWLMLAKCVGMAFALALPLVLVRRMTQQDFGLYKQVFFIVNTAVIVLPLGFGMSAFYFLPRTRERQGAVVVNIVLFQAAVALTLAAILVLWPGALATVFSSPELARLARPLALVIMLWTVGSFLEVVPLAIQDVRASTGFIVASQFSKTTVLLVAALWVGTIDALVVAAIVQGALQITMMLAYLHARFPGFWRAFDARLLGRQAAYALPIGSSSLAFQLQQDIHHAFVSNAFGPATYAVYAVGVFKVPIVGMLRESVGSVVIPRINELETRNARREILALVASAARKLALVYFPIYAFLLVTGPEVLSVLYTPLYADSWPVFAVSLTLLPLGILVLDPVTRAHEHRFSMLRLRVGLLTAVAIVLWLWSRELGLVGVIGVVVAAQVAGTGVIALRMARMLGMRRLDLRLFAGVGWAAVSAAIAAGVTAVLRSWLLPASPPAVVLAACAALFGVVYLAVAVRRVVRPGELRVLWSDVTQMGASGLRGPAVTVTPSTGSNSTAVHVPLARRG
jgi:O-antigen/teichoic acid export membrane protein